MVFSIAWYLWLSTAATAENTDGVFGNDRSLADEVITISYDAIGYSLTLMAAATVLVCHLLYWVTRLIRANSLNDNKAFLAKEGLTQRGFRRSWFGLLVKFATFLVPLWLVIAMVMVTVGKNLGTWPFDTSIPEGLIDDASYTRAFLTAWIGILLFTIVLKFTLKRMDSFYHRPCSLAVATHVKFSCVLSDEDDPENNLPVKFTQFIPVSTDPCRFVDFLNRRYTWSRSQCMFVPGSVDPFEVITGDSTPGDLQGLSTQKVLDNLREYGKNTVIAYAPGFFDTFKEHITSSFFIYQVSALWICLFWNYVTYALVVLSIIVLSIFSTVHLKRRIDSHSSLTTPTRSYSWVKRDGKWTKVSVEDVCVGDLVCVTTDSVETTTEIVADMIIVEGNAIVDETGLSGVTIPIRKCNFPFGTGRVQVGNTDLLREFTIYSGTELLHCDSIDPARLPSNIKNGCLAIVTAVSGDTMRSRMIRKMVLRRPLDTPFRTELFAAMTCLILVGFVEFVWIYNTFGAGLDAVMPAITCIVGIINPLLSLAIVIPGSRSIASLDAVGIKTKSLERLILAGKTNLCLVDKTGTITKSGFDLVGLLPAESPSTIDPKITNIPWPTDLALCVGMAHTVFRSNGKLVGDQIELQMVHAAAGHGWKFDDIRAPIDTSGTQWEILHTYPFNHEQMRMSVVVRQKTTGNLILLCKGSFESISHVAADVSDDIQQSARLHAQDGYYVIATASRELERDTNVSTFPANRNLYEDRLTFSGLLLFSNQVKDGSAECVRELTTGGMECVISTGDGLATACSVARSVGIFPPESRVILGSIDRSTRLPEWRLYDTDAVLSDAAMQEESGAIIGITGELYESLIESGKLDLTRTKIYCRMNPSQKAELVQVYASVGKIVAVCGDNANDCLALQAAHVGIAMGPNPAIRQGAAFNSEMCSLSSLTTLIREGRNALCNTIASYRFLVTFGIMQTVMRMILLVQFGGYPTAISSLIVDCIVIPLVLVAISGGTAAPKLSPNTPEGSLMGPEMILGCCWSITITLITYWLMSVILTSASWYVPFSTSTPISDWSTRVDSFDVGLASLFRFWVCADFAVAFSYGGEHRRSIAFNLRLIVVACILVGFFSYALATNGSFFNCAIGVNCTAEDKSSASESFWNKLVFTCESISVHWFGVVDSLILPVDFRVVVVSLLVLMSLIHHVGFKYIIGSNATRWISRTLGWKDMYSCCFCLRRRDPKGYRRLEDLKYKDTILNDSVMSATDDDSPITEWHKRRAHGAWRAPEPLTFR